MKIAIIGSREFKDKELVDKKVLEILGTTVTKDTIITGDARGVDTWVKNICFKYFANCEVIAPINPIDKINFLYRNVEIITKADKIFAFWDGQSRGTKFVINYAKARNKPVEIILNDGVVSKG